MAAFKWRTVRDCEFSGDEAREASDFVEVLRNFHLDPVEAYEMFRDDNTLTVAKRLVFAEKIDLDNAVTLLLSDPDERIRRVIEKRLQEERDKKNGEIIIPM